MIDHLSQRHTLNLDIGYVKRLGSWKQTIEVLRTNKPFQPAPKIWIWLSKRIYLKRTTYHDRRTNLTNQIQTMRIVEASHVASFHLFVHNTFASTWFELKSRQLRLETSNQVQNTLLSKFTRHGSQDLFITRSVTSLNRLKQKQTKIINRQ